LLRYIFGENHHPGRQRWGATVLADRREEQAQRPDHVPVHRAARQTVLTPAKERQARRMLAEGATKDEVAGVVGVSVSTLYRRLDSGVSRVGK